MAPQLIQLLSTLLTAALWWVGRVQTEFDPTSTLTTYVTKGNCAGPRGNDANADLTQCANGYVLIHERTMELDTFFTINIWGTLCDYYSWKIYMCIPPGKGKLPNPYLFPKLPRSFSPFLTSSLTNKSTWGLPYQ